MDRLEYFEGIAVAHRRGDRRQRRRAEAQPYPCSSAIAAWLLRRSIWSEADPGKQGLGIDAL